jgi:valyl-tRNA synthetase
MPFITEQIWHALYGGRPPGKSISLTSYPQFKQEDRPLPDLLVSAFERGDWPSSIERANADASMDHLKLAIVSIRSRRKELGIDDNIPVKAIVASSKPGVLKKNKEILEKLAKLVSVEIVLFADRDPGGKYESLTWQAYGQVDVSIDFDKQIDVPAERDRLTKDIAKYEKGLISAERQLGNESFLAKAPAQVIEGLKKQESETRLLLEKAKAALGALPPDSL